MTAVPSPVARTGALAASASRKPLFSYRKFWAHRFGPAPFLPMSRAEMDALESRLKAPGFKTYTIKVG